MEKYINRCVKPYEMVEETIDGIIENTDFATIKHVIAETTYNDFDISVAEEPMKLLYTIANTYMDTIRADANPKFASKGIKEIEKLTQHGIELLLAIDDNPVPWLNYKNFIKAVKQKNFSFDEKINYINMFIELIKSDKENVGVNGSLLNYISEATRSLRKEFGEIKNNESFKKEEYKERLKQIIDYSKSLIERKSRSEYIPENELLIDKFYSNSMAEFSYELLINSIQKVNGDFELSEEFVSNFGEVLGIAPKGCKEKSNISFNVYLSNNGGTPYLHKINFPKGLENKDKEEIAKIVAVSSGKDQQYLSGVAKTKGFLN